MSHSQEGWGRRSQLSPSGAIRASSARIDCKPIRLRRRQAQPKRPSIVAARAAGLPFVRAQCAPPARGFIASANESYAGSPAQRWHHPKRFRGSAFSDIRSENWRWLAASRHATYRRREGIQRPCQARCTSPRRRFSQVRRSRPRQPNSATYSLFDMNRGSPGGRSSAFTPTSCREAALSRRVVLRDDRQRALRAASQTCAWPDFDSRSSSGPHARRISDPRLGEQRRTPIARPSRWTPAAPSAGRLARR